MDLSKFPRGQEIFEKHQAAKDRALRERQEDEEEKLAEQRTKELAEKLAEPFNLVESLLTDRFATKGATKKPVQPGLPTAPGLVQFNEDFDLNLPAEEPEGSVVVRRMFLRISGEFSDGRANLETLTDYRIVAQLALRRGCTLSLGITDDNEVTTLHPQATISDNGDPDNMKLGKYLSVQMELPVENKVLVYHAIREAAEVAGLLTIPEPLFTPTGELTSV